MDLFGRKRQDSAGEQPATDVAAADDDGAPGWDAITAAFDALYPDQPEPLHIAALIKWCFGGTSTQARRPASTPGTRRHSPAS